jgi:hypothetical protein
VAASLAKSGGRCTTLAPKRLASMAISVSSVVTYTASNDEQALHAWMA